MSVGTPEWARNNPEAQDDDYAVHTVLRKWFDALQDGSVASFLPDFSYPRQWTEAELEAFVVELDTYVWKQANWVRGNRHIDADAGPGFARLTSAQRLALLQELATVLAAYPEPPPPEQPTDFTNE